MAQGKGKPEEGKIYAITGGYDDPSILRGDSWAESEVDVSTGKPTSRAKKLIDQRARDKQKAFETKYADLLKKYKINPKKFRR